MAYLEILRRVVLAPRHGLDVRRLGLGMQTLILQCDHAGADLRCLMISVALPIRYWLARLLIGDILPV